MSVKMYWGDCNDADPDVGLTSFETRSCEEGGDTGTETITCEGGEWQDWEEVECIFCTDGESQIVECGLNNRGTMTRICVEDTWSSFSECDSNDVCTDELTQTLYCGFNGNGIDEQTCILGQWVSNEGCVNSDVCENGLTQTLYCGFNDNGIDEQTCILGQWVSNEGCINDDICLNGSTRVITCGLNNRGTQNDTCVSGVWEGDCIDPDTCVDGETNIVFCGLNGRGTQTNTCIEGTEADGDCIDPDVCTDGETNEIPCGLNNRGVQTQLCVDGSLSDPSECVDPDVCTDGETTKTDDGDYQICIEGSWDFIICTVDETCSPYSEGFGFIETIFDTGVSCLVDEDCENSVCDAGTCKRFFEHLDGEDFGCLPSGVCGTCNDEDVDGICEGSSDPETCETNADCLSGQVCTPQGQCINYPDPSVTCFPFQVVLPADTNALMIYVWNSEGQLVDGAPQALPEAVEGFITINSTDYSDACGMTFEYEGRWQSHLDEIFPSGAPEGDTYFTFYEPGQLCVVDWDGAGYGVAQDAKCLMTP